MTALAEIEDLRLVMQRDLSGSEAPRANRLLDIASEAVRTFTGVHFSEVTETKRLRARNGKVRLPQGPVTEVDTVEDMDGNDVGFTWYAGQVVDCNPSLLNSFEIHLRRTSPDYVDVTYTHGFETIPADVIGVVCDMAAAALDSPPEASGTQSETMGPFTVTTGSQFPGGVRLTQSMKDRLMPYMTPVGTASIT